MKVLNTAPLSIKYQKLLSEHFDFIQPILESDKLLSEDMLINLLDAEEPDILIVEITEITKRILNNASSLKLIGVCRGGTSNIDLEAAKENEILVINTPARNSVAVSEFTIGLMILLARKILDSVEYVESGNWDDLLKTFYRFEGFELNGRTAGILGLGYTGEEVAKRLNSFNMKLLGFDPYCGTKKAKKLNISLVSLAELLQKSDFVLLHASVNKSSINIINKETLSVMKPSAYLINMARAALIDDDDLFNALKNKKIAGAALDVHSLEPLPNNSRWLSLENVILTPHLGGAAKDVIDRHSKMIFDDLLLFKNKEIPKNRVI